MRAGFVATIVGFVILLLISLGAWNLYIAFRQSEAAVRAEEQARQAMLEQRQQGDAVQQQNKDDPKQPTLPGVAPKDGEGNLNSPERLQHVLKFDPNWKNEAEGVDIEKEKQRLEWLLPGVRIPGDPGNGFGLGNRGKLMGGTRPLRQQRWSFVLPRENPDAYIRKLMELKAMLVTADGANSAGFRLYGDLTKDPPEWKKVSKEEIEKHNRLWLLSRHKGDCWCIAQALHQSQQPPWIAIFIPNDLEKAMADAEFKHRKLSELELHQKNWITVFDVLRRENGWDVRVWYQGLRQK
jgi:hypothetical protein